MSFETVLRLTGISKRFGALLANDNISIDLKRGEIVALLGENGAGKTTLMNILFGHYTADEGSIEVFGKPLPAGEPRAAIAAGIGMVHQHFTLADNLSVLDNIMLGTESLWRLSSDRNGAKRRIAQLAESFGLAVAPDAPIGALSVGERQRVEILKALYRDARILILDEPTAVLTPQESLSLFATLEATHRRRPVDHLHLAQAQRGHDGERPHLCAAVGPHGCGARHEIDQSPGACRIDGRPAGARAQGRETGARAGPGRAHRCDREGARSGRILRFTAARSWGSPASPETVRANWPIC